MSKEYIFNDLGVCINPDEEEIFNKDGISATITFSYKDKKWSYGYSIKFLNKGSFCGAWKGSYTTKKDARIQALRYIEKYLEDAKKYYSRYAKEYYQAYSKNLNTISVINKSLVKIEQLKQPTLS